MARRRASAKAIQYIKVLEQQVGAGEAARISKRTLIDGVGRPINVFVPLPSQPTPFSKERVVDHIDRDDATKLINALLDKAGRKGRRRNNRGTR